MSKEKVIAIVGTTASGKTSLAVKLAYRFGAEIISADSRQVYKYMDIGSGKDLDEYSFPDESGDMIHIPYHLIDVEHPNNVYDLSKWLLAAKKTISEISHKGSLAIIAGGSGLYAQALLDGYKLKEVGIDEGLRNTLKNKTSHDLLDILKKENLVIFNNLNSSEKNNSRRLIRYIEIEKNEAKESIKVKSQSDYDSLVIAITRPRDEIRKRIKMRLIERLEKENMIEEVEGLVQKHRLSYTRLRDLGLEYKYISLYLQKKLSYDEMQEKLYYAICQFSKRQMTWLRRWEKQGRDICWINEPDEAFEIVHSFINKYD